MDAKRWAEIKRIYESALELAPEDRGGFLAEKCAGDESLRQQVESFLECRPAAEAFLNSPAYAMASSEHAGANESRMDLTGSTLLHYSFTRKIGEGGMGEVYQAHDRKLDRQVALKILADSFAHDPERLARFDREAKLLASLNHPNIAAIYGREEAGNQRFLVLELVQGETLAQRIKRGPLPVKEAIEVCRQIAEGLEAAHEKGIIHRDLKPANVAITPDGKVKILDFGLGRALSGRESNEDLSHSPANAEMVTSPGIVLGTAAYMSPEQAKGKAVDKRADIWAFGCVLYECLTGRRPFQGESITEVVASILKSEPDWTMLPEGAPPFARRLLRHCLQKDPSLRLHDIADARIEIREEPSLPPVPEAVTVGKPFHRWTMAALVAGPVLAAAAAAFLTWHFHPEPIQPVIRFPLKLESGMWLGDWGPGRGARPTRTAMAVASDGRFFVYSAVPENDGPQRRSRIYLRMMDQTAATPVRGTEGGANPFLSPDDQWIGFWEGGKLKKVAVTGGVSTPLCDAAESMYGVDWGPDDTIIFSPAFNAGLSRISAERSKPEVLTVPEKAHQEYSHRLPHFLPGTRGLLFTIMEDAWTRVPRLAHLNLQTRRWHVVMENAADGRYLPTGHLVFMRQGTLMAVRFDIDRMEAKGQPQPVVANVMQALNFLNAAANSAAGQYDVSPSGWLAYVPGGIAPERLWSLVHVDQKGDAKPVTDFKTGFFAPRFSPDGKRISYRNTEDGKLWIYDIERGIPSRLTTEGRVGFPIWTPDGKRVVFLSGDLYWQPWDRSSPPERLSTNRNVPCPGSFTPDGAILAFTEMTTESDWNILLLDMKTRRITPFLNTSAEEGWPEFSPDGHWLAYVSDESGRREVYVRPFPGPGGQVQISNKGGNAPIWSKDGRQLFYRQTDQVWAVDIRTEGSFTPGKPRFLFSHRLHSTSPVRGLDLWPDGQGFLGVEADLTKQEQPVTEMFLVQDWFEELKRLVPTAKR